MKSWTLQLKCWSLSGEDVPRVGWNALKTWLSTARVQFWVKLFTARLRLTNSLEIVYHSQSKKKTIEYFFDLKNFSQIVWNLHFADLKLTNWLKVWLNKWLLFSMRARQVFGSAHSLKKKRRERKEFFMNQIIWTTSTSRRLVASIRN